MKEKQGESESRSVSTTYHNQVEYAQKMTDGECEESKVRS